jgi:phytoene dehydrogenase-like protein
VRDGFDAVVVGAGHNGLVAAFRLAKAGQRTLVLERRPFVGGACNTEEFAPGFKASTGAYVLSMLRGSIWKDMRLVRRDIRVDPAGPSLNLFGDGTSFTFHDDISKTIEETKRFSRSDARALPAFEERLAGVARAVMPVFGWKPPDPRIRRARDIRDLARYGILAFRNRKHLADAAFIFSTSVTQFLSERFESDVLKAALGWHAINDSMQGPSTPGTAYVMLHDHASEDASGGVREWGFVRGGMGRLTEAMADAAREAGAEIRCEQDVKRIVTRGGRVAGVLLSSGEEIVASRVLSNADPKRTFLGLCDPSDLPTDFLGSIRAYRCEGTSIKMNLALSGLPTAKGMPGGTQDYHRGIIEVNSTLNQMDRDQDLARAGTPADPAHIEICFPTVHDPSLAPEGRHIATIDINSQPYRLADGHWDGIKEGRADRAITQLAEHFPDLPNKIMHRQVLSPLDLERMMGLTGGHALHGEMTPDQLFFLRPVRGYADYRTPIPGLYLCGAGTHPGGGVTGTNGLNCAREVLLDSKRGGRG